MAAEGDAYAGANHHRPPDHGQRLEGHVTDAVSRRRGLARRGLRQDNHELVAGEPPHGVAGTDRSREPGGQLGEHPITGLVPAAVVDALDAVQVADRSEELRVGEEWA